MVTADTSHPLGLHTDLTCRCRLCLFANAANVTLLLVWVALVEVQVSEEEAAPA